MTADLKRLAERTGIRPRPAPRAGRRAGVHRLLTTDAAEHRLSTPDRSRRSSAASSRDAACMDGADRLLRAVRRVSGLSQRGLADRAGVTHRTVERAERPGSTCGLDTFATLIEAAGCELVVLGPDGHRMRPDDVHDRLRQRDGRRFPAHLPWAPVRQDDHWWGWYRVARWPSDAAVPAHQYWHQRPLTPEFRDLLDRLFPACGDTAPPAGDHEA